MPRRSTITLKGVLPFAAAGVFFGLLYNTRFYPRALVEYAEAGTSGLVLGSVAGLAEQTVLERVLRQRSLLQAMVLRTLLYAVPVALVLALALAIEPVERALILPRQIAEGHGGTLGLENRGDGTGARPAC